MSNAQKKGKRDSSKRYAERGNRDKNKQRRIAKDARRAKPMECGHGSRHKSKYDDKCKRCHGSVAQWDA